MPIDPISWTIIIALTGATVGYFWEEIAAWVTRAIGYILDKINRAIEVTSDAIVYLVKKVKDNRYYKRVEVFARNIYTNATRLLAEQEEVAEEEIPSDVRAQLDSKAKLELGRRAT